VVPSKSFLSKLFARLVRSSTKLFVSDIAPRALRGCPDGRPARSSRRSPLLETLERPLATLSSPLETLSSPLETLRGEFETLGSRIEKLQSSSEKLRDAMETLRKWIEMLLISNETLRT
jgi:chromosome segregation ATPase